MLIRQAVSDRHVTEEEHRKLDLARDLIGIPEAEAEAILHAIVAEAEAFFGKPVEEVLIRDRPDSPHRQSSVSGSAWGFPSRSTQASVECPSARRTPSRNTS